jgi:DNA-binding CsgD family transcriptional regulator
MARDRYNQLAKERDRIKLKKQQMEQLTLGILFIFFVMGLVVLLMWRSDRRKAELEQVHDKLLLKEREEQYKQSQKKLEENQEQLTELERQLEEARLQSDAERTERLEQEARLLEAQNASIAAIQKQKQRLREQLQLSELYRRLKLDDGVTKRHLTDEEWTQLATDFLDPLYDRLTNRLLALADLSATELRICYMIKLEIAPADMADILSRTTSAVSQSRRRIYQKLTGQPGSAQQLDELIEAF